MVSKHPYGDFNRDFKRLDVWSGLVLVGDLGQMGLIKCNINEVTKGGEELYYRKYKGIYIYMLSKIYLYILSSIPSVGIGNNNL